MALADNILVLLIGLIIGVTGIYIGSKATLGVAWVSVPIIFYILATFGILGLSHRRSRR